MGIDNDTHPVMFNANNLLLNNDKTIIFNSDSFGSSTTEKNIINALFNIINDFNNVYIEKKQRFIM